MQGGHRDGLNPVLNPGCDKESEPMDTAYDSVEEISLSHTGDTIVQALRRAWIFLLATPVAWAHLEPNAIEKNQTKAMLQPVTKVYPPTSEAKTKPSFI